MADVSFTMTATLTGITAGDLKDALCAQWNYDADEHGTKVEFIQFMLKRYVKQAYKAGKIVLAGKTAGDEADAEVS